MAQAFVCSPRLRTRPGAPQPREMEAEVMLRKLVEDIKDLARFPRRRSADVEEKKLATRLKHFKARGATQE